MAKTSISALLALAGFASGALIFQPLAEPALAADASQPATIFPKARPGLWKLSSAITLNGARSPGPWGEICIGQGAGAGLLERAVARMPAGCHAPAFHRDPDGKIRGAASCTARGGATGSYTVTVGGDFTSSIVVDGDGALTGGSDPGSRTDLRSVLTLSWTGSCRKGQEAGDMIINRPGHLSGDLSRPIQP